MEYLKQKNNIFIKKFFSFLFLFLYVFSFPVAVFGQEVRVALYTETGIYDPGNKDYDDSEIYNTQIPAPGPQGRAETTYGSEGGRGIVDMNLLYPGSLPNSDGRGNDDYVTDFASCIAGIMVVKLANMAIYGLAMLGQSAAHAMDKVTSDSADTTWGIPALALSQWTESKVQDTKARATHYDVGVFGVPLLPSLDDMAFCAKNVLFAYISSSVVKWVNEAVNGSAAWVESLSDQLTNVYALSYRKAIGEADICIDVEFAVKVGIDLSFLKTQPLPPRGGCTISIAERHHLELMYNHGVYDPDLFAKVYSNPNNNAMGAFLLVDAAANTNAEWNEKVLLNELDWNNGFWPFKDEHGRIVTPGRFIEDKVINALNLETDHSFFADEWDRVIFMITNQIAKQEIGKALRPLAY